MPTNPEQRVTIAGLGAIGRSIAQRLDNGIPGWRLAAVASRDAAKAQAFLSTLKYPVPLVPMKPNNPPNGFWLELNVRLLMVRFPPTPP